MQANRTCPKCGAALAATGAGGFCTACLLETGLEERGTPLEAAPPLRRVGDYELLFEIARGGMGVVYRARQVSLDRAVAVKMILAGHFAGPADLQRFRAEAQAAANLQHPNIVAIHEVGEHEGQPFFSMDLVAGRSLADIVREGALPAARAARYVQAIAAAIHHAHEHGILHRDLKPSNVLIDEHDQPRVTDFGLAKQVSNAELGTPNPELTLTGQVLGSPNFMPPEQTAGRRGAAGPAGDIYSLGALLYHLVTGRPPFVAETIPATLRLVAETDPIAPRLLDPALPLDLETICLKCLEKDPRRRYASAQELADELGRFLRDEPIHARPVVAAEKLLRWCRRHPALAGVSAFAMVLLLAVAVISTVAATRLKRANTAAKEKLREALVAQARAHRSSKQAGRRAASLEALKGAAAIRPSLELRNEAIAALTLPDVALAGERPLPKNAGAVGCNQGAFFYAMALAPDRLSVRRVADDSEAAVITSVGSGISIVSLNAAGNLVAFGSGRVPGWLSVYDLDRRQFLLEELPYSPISIAFSTDSAAIAVAQPNGLPVAVIELPSGRELVSLPQKLTPHTVCFNRSGELLAVSCADSFDLQLFDWRRGARHHTFTLPRPAQGISWHPEGRWLACPASDGRIYLCDTETKQIRVVLNKHGSVARQSVFSTRGDLLVTGSEDGVLRVWDPFEGVELSQVSFSGQLLGFNAEDALFARSASNAICRFEVSWGPACRRLRFDGDWQGAGFVCQFSPDGTLLASGHSDGLRIWNPGNGGLLAHHAQSSIDGLAFHPSGEWFLTTDFDPKRAVIQMWPVKRTQTAAGRSVGLGPPERFGPTGWIERPSFDRAGDRFMIGANGVPNVFDGGRREKLFGLGDGSFLRGPVIDPAGKLCVVWHDAGRHLRIWDLESRRETRALRFTNANTAIFSSDGRWLVAASPYAYAAWDTRDWRQAWTLRRENPRSTHGCAAIAPGDRIVACAMPRSVLLVDLLTGRELATLEPPDAPFTSWASFSPDGRYLAVAARTHYIHLWDLNAARRTLAGMKLDWDTPPPAVSRNTEPEAPLTVSFLRVPPPARDPRCTSRQIDLGAHYTTSFGNFSAATGLAGNDFAPLPTGLQTFAGVLFDVRGLVQVSRNPGVRGVPTEVVGIRVNQACAALNFLHACVFSTPRGALVGEYVVHYSDGQRSVIALKDGENIADWWAYPPTPHPLDTNTVVAWRGENAASARVANKIQLYRFRWENPRPEVPIAAIDFNATGRGPAPFLVAITAVP